MVDFIAVLAMFAVGIPIAAVFYLLGMRREWSFSSRISMLRIGIITVGILFIFLLVETLFEFRTIGVLVRWIVDTFPSVVGEEAKSPLVFIAAIIISAGSFLGLFGLGMLTISQQREKHRYGFGLIGLAAAIVIALFLLTSNQAIFDEYWLGEPIWPIELLVNYFPPIAGAATGVSITVLILWLGRTNTVKDVPLGSSGVVSLFAMALTIATLILLIRSFSVESENAARIEVLPVNAVQSTLPDGFVLGEVTEPGSFNSPTSLTVRPDGVIFVSTSDGIFAVKPTSVKTDRTVIQKFSEISRATGIHWHNDHLYVSVNGEVIAIKDSDNNLESEETRILISDLPSYKYSFHTNNELVVGADDRLYFAIGGTSDHGPENYELGGTVVSLRLDGSDLRIFSTGLRNSYGITACADGQLYVSENGPDQIDSTLLGYPPDEINKLLEGRNYGYPEIFGNPPPWSDTIAPVALLPERAGSAGLVCYEHDAFPDDYSGDLFVALFGTLTGNIGDEYEGGRRIVRVDLQDIDGYTVGKVSTFASGFGHPVDVAVDIDGSLLTIDWEVGQLFKISYEP